MIIVIIRTKNRQVRVVVVPVPCGDGELSRTCKIIQSLEARPRRHPYTRVVPQLDFARTKAATRALNKLPTSSEVKMKPLYWKPFIYFPHTENIKSYGADCLHKAGLVCVGQTMSSYEELAIGFRRGWLRRHTENWGI
ncbi:hypothetical protein EVAR_92363_1 [Eumeta japonica]|uniref:Uncharacterized protein n=1 Tax=Eumeta variegata TaxID=151549 RepID=A0A4C1TM30_EUMVA|nr:hypothetical protein EVAR_92363_1 [Eumeta japonica]